MSLAVALTVKCDYHLSVTIGLTGGQTHRQTLDKVIRINHTAKHRPGKVFMVTSKPKSKVYYCFIKFYTKIKTFKNNSTKLLCLV